MVFMQPCKLVHKDASPRSQMLKLSLENTCGEEGKRMMLQTLCFDLDV